MGYLQIDGNKALLIHESGKVREGLKNLPEDSDRFVYARDKKGKKKNVWPKLIITHDTDGGEDIRLMPEIVMKHHGKLPQKLECSESDFKAIDGNKLNVGIDNLEYVGDGSFKKAKPYKQPPSKQDDTPEEEDGQPEVEKANDNEPEGVAPAPAGKPADSDPEEELSDLAKGSGALNAKKAVEIIEKYDFEELQDSGFLTETEGKERVTVIEAWEKSKKKWQAEQSKS